MFSLKEFKPSYTKGKANSRFFHIFTADGKKISLKYSNVKTLFGIEKKYNDKIIKWCIDDQYISVFNEIANSVNTAIKAECNHDQSLDINNNVIQKMGYPTMIETHLKDSLQSIMKHEEGVMLDNSSLKKNTAYCIELSINTVFLDLDKNKISYKYLLKRIS